MPLSLVSIVYVLPLGTVTLTVLSWLLLSLILTETVVSPVTLPLPSTRVKLPLASTSTFVLVSTPVMFWLPLPLILAPLETLTLVFVPLKSRVKLSFSLPLKVILSPIFTEVLELSVPLFKVTFFSRTSIVYLALFSLEKVLSVLPIVAIILPLELPLPPIKVTFPLSAFTFVGLVVSFTPAILTPLPSVSLLWIVAPLLIVIVLLVSLLNV